MPSPELIMFIGLQASGKSSFFDRHFSDAYTHVSKDLLRNNGRPARRQQQLISATIIGYYFEPRVSQCLERNRQRTGKARVPDVAIFATLKKLVRPSYQEGFDRLFKVRIADDGAFEVSDWIEEETKTPPI